MPRGFPGFASNVTETTFAKKQAMLADAKVIARQMGRLDLRAAFIAASNEANDKTAKALKEIGEAFKRGVMPSAETLKINQSIGQKAKAATVKSYSGYSRGPSGYRPGGGKKNRYSGGRLRRALESESMYQATATSISFVDVSILNRTAKQWGRLNFGAGGYGEQSPKARMFPLRISNLVIASVGLGGDVKPRAAFFLPVGFFDGSGPVGKDRFTPGFPRTGRVSSGEGNEVKVIRERMLETRGIRAEHFLDAGVASMAREIGPRYLAHIRTLATAGKANYTPTKYTTSNKPTPMPGRIGR